MNSRERVLSTLNHMEPDRIPLDLGGTSVTGIHVSSLHSLKVALGLITPDEPVKVSNPFLMLGEVDEDLRRVLGIDTIPLSSPSNFFGFPNTDWKPWRLFDGTPVLIPGLFNTEPDRNGSIVQYPRGDRSRPPSARMPGGGFYHDAIIRKPVLDENELTVENQTEEYQVMSEEQLRWTEVETIRLYEETDFAIISRGVAGTNLGDIAHIPGCALLNPRGIRDVEEWYVSLVTRKTFLHDVFTRMTDIALENLQRFYQAVGEKIQVIVVSAADFGSQNGLFISRELYEVLFKPFHKRINAWIHQHSGWKTFIHTCGSVKELLLDLHEAGFDILNPVQISAVNMDPGSLKKEYGELFTFWGGGIDTQHTLPFGTPEDIRQEVKHLIDVFRPGGGFVWNTVHNLQANIPQENLITLFEAFRACR
ncbi:MAG: methyltransferase [Candidatus Atribacteria bacterium]|nr:methyltransferase [Candidatus Atribacteria bacterium]